MKNLTRIFLVVAMACAGVACTTDTTEDLGVAVGGQTQITISLEESRTQLGIEADGVYPLYWSNGDKISVNGVASNEISVGENATCAEFTIPAALSAPYCIAYPATEAGQVLFAAEQTHVSNTTFGSGVSTMYAYSESGVSAQLKHLTGVLKIGVKGSTVLKKAAISTANGPIAGAFEIDFTTGEFTPAAGASNVINYSFGEGLQLTDAAQYMHIAVPAGEYNFLHVTLYDSEDNVMVAGVKADDEKPLNAGCVRTFSTPILYTPNSNDIVIASYEDLVKFASVAATTEKSALLVENIVIPEDATWTPIENFANTFNGNGFEISGLKNSLFGTLEGATVKNLKLNIDINVADARPIVGGLVSVLKSTATKTATIDNCVVSGKMTIASTYKGATDGNEEIAYSPMVAQAFSATITNCVNNAAIDVKAISASTTVQIKPSVGGVVGVIKNATDLTGTSILKNCVNSKSATITWNEDKSVNNNTKLNPYIAGVVGGYLVNGTAENLKNYADISVTSQMYVPGIGGVCGYYHPTAGAHFYNYGDILLNAATSYAYWGGVLGSCYNAVQSLSHCENHGNVTFGKNASCIQRNYIGGIIGTSQTDGAVYSNLKNFGTIASYGDNSASRFQIAGIIAFSVKIGKLENCVNGEQGTEKGKIIAEGKIGLKETYYPSIGGVCASFQSGSKGDLMIKGCTNYAPIVASQTIVNLMAHAIGGVAGWVRSGATIEDCSNYGHVDCTELTNEAKLQSFIGGVVGIVSDAKKEMNNNHNYGAITVGEKADARFQLGGVVGYTSYGVTNCSNSGKIIFNGSPSIATSETGSLQGSGRTDADVNNRSNIAGVAAKIYNTSLTTSISGLTNTGDIHLPQADSIRCTAIGGVLGEATLLKVTVSKLSNSGDIKVENVNNKAMLNYLGGVIGRNFNNNISSQTMDISECTNSGNISLSEKTATNHVRAGGIIADLLAAGSNKRETLITISNCTNSGNISRTTTTKTGSSQSYAGGIVGAVGGKPGSANESLMGTALTISGCENSGSIQFEQTNGSKALDNSADCNAFGGIVGMMYGGLTNTPAKQYVPEVVSCVNKGTISSYAGAVGGIAGLIYDWGKVEGNEDAYNVNEGEVKLLGTSAGYAGGVVGYLHLVDTTNNYMTCTYNANKGTVSGNKYVGGIVGYSGVIVDEKTVVFDGVKVTNCVNVGNVEGTITDANYAGYIGGIAGYIIANITDSKVYSSVRRNNYLNVGMVTGSARAQDTVVATNCQVGGAFVRTEYDAADEIDKEVKTPLTSNDYFNYIYGGTTDWTDVESYDGCTLLEAKPSTITPAE